jgi:hypothetical protein
MCVFFVCTLTGTSAAIIISMLLNALFSADKEKLLIKEIKQKLIECGVPVRPWIDNYNSI